MSKKTSSKKCEVCGESHTTPYQFSYGKSQRMVSGAAKITRRRWEPKPIMVYLCDNCVRKNRIRTIRLWVILAIVTTIATVVGNSIYDSARTTLQEDALLQPLVPLLILFGVGFAIISVGMIVRAIRASKESIGKDLAIELRSPKLRERGYNVFSPDVD